MEKRDFLALITFSLIGLSFYIATINPPSLSPSDICNKQIKINSEINSQIFESQYDLGDTSDYHELACLRSLAAAQAKADASEKAIDDCSYQVESIESKCDKIQKTPCLLSPNLEIKTLSSEYFPSSGKTYCKMQATAKAKTELFCSCD